MSILKKFPKVYANAYYDEKFRAILEDHMRYLRQHPTTTVMSVVAIDALRYRGDLYGYLTANKIPIHLHWVIMRVNDLTSPNQFSEETLTLIIPDALVVDNIKQQFSTVVV